MGEPSSFPPSLRHIPSLDGIRGLAILLVLSFHLLWSNSVTGSRFLDLVVKLRTSGWIGVDLFFALSGFLITGILLDTRENPRFLRNFYARRTLRIIPLYYLVLLLLFLSFHPSTLTETRPFLVLAAFLQNTPFWWKGSGAVSGHIANYTAHLWSIAAEEQFYLLWPLVLVLVPSRRKLLWIAGALFALSPLLRYLLLAHGAPVQVIYKLAPCHADSLLAGSWLALANRGPLRPRLLRLAPAALALSTLACVALACATGNFDYDHNRAVDLIGFSLLAVAGASLICLALAPDLLPARLLRAPSLRFFGKYSYGLYVLHQMVATAFEERLGPLLRGAIHPKPLLHLASMAMILAVTIPLAMLSFHFVERPFLHLKELFRAYPGRGRARLRARPSHSPIPSSASSQP